MAEHQQGNGRVMVGDVRVTTVVEFAGREIQVYFNAPAFQTMLRLDPQQARTLGERLMNSAKALAGATHPGAERVGGADFLGAVLKSTEGQT